ncbi:MAG: TlpA family protein disulfide reductase [Chloroflexota bacterium]
MRRPQAAIGASLLVLVVAAAGVALVRPAGRKAESYAPRAGHLAPLFALKDTRGRLVTLRQLKGTPVLINFFATWCIPCRSEMPRIETFYRSHSSDLRVLAVDKAEPASDVQSFAASFKLQFVPVLDSNYAVSNQYGVYGIQPVSFWLDARGTIRAVDYGPMTAAQMSAGLRKVQTA